MTSSATTPTSNTPPRAELDITDPNLASARRWRDYDTIINATAYTAVDTAETPTGRATAWAVNVTAVATLARIAAENRITLVHVSSDYVYDGTKHGEYTENDPTCPLGVYGQTKAAGDAITTTVPRHYLIRTSWVIGDGNNFVRTMATLAQRGINPKVVNDQVGRLTFTTTLAEGIHHLLNTRPEYGTYNLTGTGEPTTWADIARHVYELTGHDPNRITPVTTDEYFAAPPHRSPPAPTTAPSTPPKITTTGYTAPHTADSLATYLHP